MSASTNLHGPFTASARLIPAGQYASTPFVTVQISTEGADFSLLRIDADGLEALSAAVGTARVLLESITAPPIAPADGTPACTCTDPWCPDPVHQLPADPPEPDPDDAEAQRIAEVFADARAEQDRGL